MAIKIVPLNDIQVKNAKPSDKNYKMFDGGGLFLFVKTDGSKLWRAKYRFGGIENTASFGKYPQISLLQARQKLTELKAKIADGINPAEEKALIKQTQKEQHTKEINTLVKVFTDWLETKKIKTVCLYK